MNKIDIIAKEKGIDRSALIREAIETYSAEKLQLEIPIELKEKLSSFSKKSGATSEQILIDALNKYIWKIRAESVREKLIPAAREKGIVTEEDVFRRIS